MMFICLGVSVYLSINNLPNGEYFLLASGFLVIWTAMIASPATITMRDVIELIGAVLSKKKKESS